MSADLSMNPSAIHCSTTTQPIRPNEDSVGETSHAAACNAEVKAFDECMEEVGGFGEELAEGKEESDNDEYDEEDRAERPRDQEAQEREEADDPDPGPHPAPGEEEVCPPQVASQPRLPSREQVDLHEAMGHAQYRSWCEDCIFGQGREDRHLRNRDSQRSMPVIGYDYAFLSAKDEEDVRKGRKSACDVTRLLVGKDSKSKAHFAHVTPHKGVSQSNWNFECVNKDLQRLRYRRLILKNDKEPAIVAQVREAQRIANGMEVIDELAHTGDPQSNGEVEQAVRNVKAKTISIVATLERRIKLTIPLSHPIVGWAAEYAADCLNIYVLGADGMSVIQRLRGGNPRQPVANFGETVIFPMLRR